MIIGRIQDMAAVALFSRGGGIVELFSRTVLRGVVPVCLPYFAKNNRESGSIVSGYLQSISYLTAVGWPFFAFAGVMSYSAVRIIYGNQWLASVPLTKILCLVGAIELVHYLSKEALISVQEVKRSNGLQLCVQALRIAGLFAVLPFGLQGACYGLLAASIASFFLAQRHLNATVGLTLRQVFRACSTSATTTLLSAGPIAVLALFLNVDETNFLRLGAGAACLFLPLWLLSLRHFKHPLWTEISGLATKLIKKLGFGPRAG